MKKTKDCNDILNKRYGNTYISEIGKYKVVIKSDDPICDLISDLLWDIDKYFPKSFIFHICSEQPLRIDGTMMDSVPNRYFAINTDKDIYIKYHRSFNKENIVKNFNLCAENIIFTEESNLNKKIVKDLNIIASNKIVFNRTFPKFQKDCWLLAQRIHLSNVYNEFICELYEKIANNKDLSKINIIKKLFHCDVDANFITIYNPYLEMKIIILDDDLADKIGITNGMKLAKNKSLYIVENFDFLDDIIEFFQDNQIEP